MSKPFVSIIIPCLNEAEMIKACLESVFKCDYPTDRLEVLVIDGLSRDGTREILTDFCRRESRLKIIDNPKQSIPAALNTGIRAAMGEIVIRMDAHTTYAPNYVSLCVETLLTHDVDDVGGVIDTHPRNASLMARAIALALSHPFGVGNSTFRTGSATKCFVDTAPFFCCRKKLFSEIGYFDERLTRSEDIELKKRIVKRGPNRILLNPEIRAHYFARGDFRSFLLHNTLNGFWSVYPFLYIRNIPVSLRHLAPLLALLIFFSLLTEAMFFDPRWLLLTLVYVLLTLLSSLQVGKRMGSLKLALLMPLIFFSLHFSYAMGSLWGGVKVLTSPHFWALRLSKTADKAAS